MEQNYLDLAMGITFTDFELATFIPFGILSTLTTALFNLTLEGDLPENTHLQELCQIYHELCFQYPAGEQVLLLLPLMFLIRRFLVNYISLLLLSRGLELVELILVLCL